MIDSQASRIPIFIVGSGRSGTSLIREVLNQHPNLYVIKRETTFVEWLGKFYSKYPVFSLTEDEVYSKLVGFLDNGNLKDFKKSNTYLSPDNLIKSIIYQYMKSHQSKWVEKSPSHVWYLDIIYRLFPDCKFIHCIRDSRDVVASMYKWELKPSGWGLLGDAALWKYSINTALEVSNKLPKQCIYHLRYEDFVFDPVDGINNLCNFLGEKPSENMFAVKYQNSSHYGCNYQSSITTNSVGIWKKVFSSSQSELIEYITQPELQKLGYISALKKCYNISKFQQLASQGIYSLVSLKRRLKYLSIKSTYMDLERRQVHG